MKNNELIEALKKINVFCTQKELDQLNKYFELLITWNEKINLTAITDREEVNLKHFYDSLTLSTIVDLSKENSLCDVGTGAGFPGIVLKIFFPHLKLILVDALNKRLNFLKVVCEELGLENVEFIHARAEDFSRQNREKYDIVTARAVSKLNILLELCTPLVKENKYFIAMKGRDSEVDLCDKAILELGLTIEKKINFELPYDGGERNLVKLKKTSKTNKKYPRKFSEIKNRPL